MNGTAHVALKPKALRRMLDRCASLETQDEANALIEQLTGMIAKDLKWMSKFERDIRTYCAEKDLD